MTKEEIDKYYDYARMNGKWMHLRVLQKIIEDCFNKPNMHWNNDKELKATYENWLMITPLSRAISIINRQNASLWGIPAWNSAGPIYKKDKYIKPKTNGHDYVDLGLPSGTLWATMNVGASKPSDAGLYFQWGDVKGYTKEEVGKGSQFNWYDYKFRAYPNFSKYTDYGSTLELEDDAAHVHMGGSWHMPTREQLKELIDNTTSTWTSQDGVNGRLFTSKKDTSKSIFIPAAGNASSGSLSYSGDNGGVWSSMLNAYSVYNGQSLYFDSSGVLLDYSGRYDGFSVRGVLG